MGRRTYTVLGFYEDNGQRYGTEVEAYNAAEAEDVVLINSDEGDLRICAVLEGSHKSIDSHLSVRGIYEVESLNSLPRDKQRFVIEEFMKDGCPLEDARSETWEHLVEHMYDGDEEMTEETFNNWKESP